MMKKWFVGLALLLCLVLCCAGGLAETSATVTSFDEFTNALDNQVDEITLTDSITFTSDVDIGYSVKILYDNDVSILGSDYTLTINDTVTMGDDVAGTTRRSFYGNVYVDVVNHGKLQGSTTFRGKVTNYGEIAAAHCFLGEYEEQGDGNSSYVYLEFDFGGVVVQEYESESTVSSGTTTVRENKIYGKVICGQKPKNGIIFENTDRWVSDIVKLDGSQLEVTRTGFDLTWWMGDNGFNINEPLVSASTKNVVISANWSAKKGYTPHTLSFHANGGTGTMEPIKFLAGERLKLSKGAKFSRKTEEGDNYSFLGWNTAQDGKGNAYSSKGDIITLGDEDVTLYAQWTTVTTTDGVFSVTYHNKDSSNTWYVVETDGSLAYSDSPREVKSSDSITSMTPPSDDMVFAGWSFNTDGSGTLLQAGDRVTLIEGGESGPGVHLYAVWESKYIDVENESQLRTAVQDTSGKTIRLLDRITLTQNLTIANNVTIDMNGNSIMGSDPTIQVNEGCTLTLMNSTTTGISGNMNPTVKNNGTIKMQDAVIFKAVKQGEKGSIDHTPRNEYFPHIDCIYVQTSSQLESALSLTISDYPHVGRVCLDKDITLANDVTLPANMSLDLNGHTLSGSKTLTLASGSIVTDNEGETGCVTCKVDDKGAGISAVAVTVTYKSGISSVTNPAAQTIIRGQKATAPTVSCEGFTFQHWSKQGETAAFDFDTSITASTTLVAQWDAIPASDEDELRAAVASNPSKPIRLTESFNLSSNLDITGDVTIDMNGNHMGCGVGVDGVSISPAGKLTLKNSKDGSEAVSSFGPPILNQGILALEGNIYAANVSLMGSGSVLHTPYKDTKYPYMADVFVENCAQLEKVLSLADGETNHFFDVWLSKDIALENDVTLPKNVFLYLNGHTLSGNATLKLSADSTLDNSDDDDDPLGSVTCGLTIDDDAIISPNLVVYISFKTGTLLFSLPTQGIVRGQKAVAPTVPADIGFTLQHWSKQGETTEFDFNTSIFENMTLVAEWDAIPVRNELELRDAVSNSSGKTIRLTNSFELTGGLNVSNDAIIDLNGNQLTYDGENGIAINPGAKLTFRNSQSDNKKWSCVYLPINNEGTLAVEGYITIDDATLCEGATIQHTPYDGSYPLVGTVRVDDSAALENVLSLADGTKNYVVNVVLDADITLETDVTLPANVTLYLEGRTLSGDKTLTLAEGAVVLNSMDDDDYRGCVTCGLVDNGADIDSILLCTVTFSGEYVTDESQTVLRGQPVSKPKDPQNEGHTFAGWYNGDSIWDFSNKVMESMSLTALWDTDVCTVTLEYGSKTATKEVAYGDNFFINITPTQDGYVFVGWYLEGKLYDWDTPVTQDITLKAQWIPIAEQFDLTVGQTYYFDLSSLTIPGTANTAIPDATLHYVPFIYMGTTTAYRLTADEIPDVNYAESNAVSHSLFMSVYNLTHTVSWTQLNQAGLIFARDYSFANVPYQLRVASGGTTNTAVAGLSEWSMYYKKDYHVMGKFESAYSWAQDATKYGHAFRGSHAIINGSSATTDFTNKTLGYRPALEAPQYTKSSSIKAVTLDLNGGSLDGQTSILIAVHENGFNAPTNEGLTGPEGKAFVGWLADNAKVYAVGEAVPGTCAKLTAQWQDTHHTVTFDVDGKTTTATVQHGETVEQPADPAKEGFIFMGWYNGATVYDFTSPVIANVTLTAKWQAADAPAFNGLIDGKTYCGPVTFSVRANSLTRAIDDVSVTVNGTALTPDVHGAYTLKPAAGVQKVVATNTDGKSTVATVTVNDGHTWGAWASNGNDTHTRTCTVGGCSETETASCTGGKADCTDKAVCAECGSAYGTVDANAHAGLTHVPAKASTTTEAGNSEYWHCEHCGKYFADAAATKEINQADTILPLQPEVPKTGDPAPLALWACLMLLGIGGLAAMRKRIHS